jgi:glycosyltransferase involved in cell wall biosynthesis
MRVLYFSRGYTPHDHRFLAALQESPHEVHFLRLEEGLATESRPVPPRITELRWPAGRRNSSPRMNQRLVRHLRGILADLRPDIVHAGPVPRCALATALAGYRPLVSMSWGSDLLTETRRGLTRLAARFTLARSEVLVCDCQAVRRAARRLGMADQRIVVFPWGVDLSHFSPGRADDLRSRLGWERAFVLLSARAWEPIYGLEILVDGFVQAARVDRDLRLLVLGDGGLRPQIMGRLGEAALLERVHFAGRVAYTDLPTYYRAADVYISASRSDGSSVSLLESMACGRPSIVSDIAGNREWIEPGATGWWFGDGSGKSLAGAIAEARRSEKALPDLGWRARKVVEERADWERNFPRLLDAYDMAVAHHERRPV